MPSFAYSSKSGLEQKRPKWNPTEILELDYFQNKTLLKVGLDLSSLGIQSNNFQVRFGCNANSGPYNKLPSKGLVKFPGRGSIRNIRNLCTRYSCNLWFEHCVLKVNFSRTQFQLRILLSLPKWNISKSSGWELEKGWTKLFPSYILVTALTRDSNKGVPKQH